MTDRPIENEPKPFESVRVLVAESDSAALNAARGCLEQFGCAVDVANDGIGTVRLTQMNRYGVVFIAGELTGLGSQDAARRIREYEDVREKGIRVPIIALLAQPSDEERGACFAAGMHGWIAKPLAAENLRRVLERWIMHADRVCAAAAVNRAAAGKVRTVADVEARAKAPPIERATLESIRALATPDRPDVLQEVVEVYLKSAEQLLRSLAEAATGKDVLAMVKAANALKSGSSNVGAVTLAELCRELARLDAGAENMRPIYQQVVEEFQRVRTALESELRRA